jgi:hypothetical protein
MHDNEMRPAAGQSGTGLGISLSSAASNSDHITTAFAIKKILARVAVSQSLALVIAAHAGLLREARN